MVNVFIILMLLLRHVLAWIHFLLKSIGQRKSLLHYKTVYKEIYMYKIYLVYIPKLIIKEMQSSSKDIKANKQNTLT